MHGHCGFPYISCSCLWQWCVYHWTFMSATCSAVQPQWRHTSSCSNERTICMCRHLQPPGGCSGLSPVGPKTLYSLGSAQTPMVAFCYGEHAKTGEPAAVRRAGLCSSSRAVQQGCGNTEGGISSTETSVLHLSPANRTVSPATSSATSPLLTNEICPQSRKPQSYQLYEYGLRIVGIKIRQDKTIRGWSPK